MIEAHHFVEAARERGFEWYAGVPCSYLTPFINYVLQDQSLRYVSMANEGDAVALIAGIALAGTDGRHRRVLTRKGTVAKLPRPAIAPVDVKTRLMQHFAPPARVR